MLLLSLLFARSLQETQDIQKTFEECKQQCHTDGCYYLQCLLPFNNELDMGVYDLPEHYWHLAKSTRFADMTTTLQQYTIEGGFESILESRL